MVGFELLFALLLQRGKDVLGLVLSPGYRHYKYAVGQTWPWWLTGLSTCAKVGDGETETVPMLVLFWRTAKHGGSRSHDGCLPTERSLSLGALGACLPSRLDGKCVSTVSHTPPSSSPFPSDSTQALANTSHCQPRVQVDPPRSTRASTRRSHLFIPIPSYGLCNQPFVKNPCASPSLFTAPAPFFFTPSRASPMSRSASLGPRRHCCCVVLVVAPTKSANCKRHRRL